MRGCDLDSSGGFDVTVGTPVPSRHPARISVAVITHGALIPRSSTF